MPKGEKEAFQYVSDSQLMCARNRSAPTYNGLSEASSHDTSQSLFSPSPSPSLTSSVPSSTFSTTPSSARSYTDASSSLTSSSISPTPAPANTCWNYPTECWNSETALRCPGRTCSANTCIDPYPCVDDGEGTSTCASWATLKNDPTTYTICT